MTTLSTRSRGMVAAVCTFMLLLVGIVAVILSGSRGPASVESMDSQADPSAEPATELTTPSVESADEKRRRSIVGVWEDDYQGHRTMTLRDDGTGTLVVELTGMAATLFAARLQFEIRWSVAGGRFHERCVGGEPAAKVNMILKTMGDHVDQPILELTDRRLLLLDKDGATRYDWRRVR